MGDSNNFFCCRHASQNFCDTVIENTGAYFACIFFQFQLTSFVVSVPASSTSSYVVCSASGQVDHNQLNNNVRVGIDAVPNTTDTSSPDRIRILEAISISSEEDVQSWAVQNVYTFTSAGGSQRYALKVCRQNTANSAGLSWDPLVCEVFPTLR